MKHFYASANDLNGFKPIFLLFLFLFTFSLPAIAADIKLEAENAVLSGTETSTEFPGYSGSGYVWGFDNGTDHVSFDFTVAEAGEYELSIIYTSPYGSKFTTLQVNSESGEKELTQTDGFTSLSVGKYLLAEGQNTITITSNWGWYGIDFIVLSPATAAPVDPITLVDGRAEAEEGILTDVVVSTDPAGFSGTGYVSSFDNSTDKLTLPFNISAGLYELHIGHTSPYGPKGFDFTVNAERGSGMFEENTGFGTVNAGKFLLNEGMNTITISRGWGYFGVDYIELIPATAPLPAKTSDQLTDKEATQSTRALFSYLTDLYGTKTLSGQYDDIEYVYEQTGKYPAIGGWDLMEYSPSRIEYGANPEGLSESYIAWAKKDEGNGIVTLDWHWNAPTDLINEGPDKLWWSGFYTRATTFDLAAALADKNSERYQLLIRDIDAIAAELKKFQEADVPVIWRPLHEAAGGWFWWGAKGAGPFKELWHILYDRLTHHHQIHNLIWVFTSDRNFDWYPGDDYVDMVGLDIYTDPSANMSADWVAMQEFYGGNKMVALSESGTLPVPDKVRGYGTWWSWFAVWNGGFIKDQPLDLLRSVYHDKDIITRDELPDWRLYGAPTVTLTAPAINAQYLECETIMITAQAADEEGQVTDISFFANDVLIGTDNTPDNGWSFDWPTPEPGTWSLKALATDNEGNTNTSEPVSVTINADEQAPVVSLSSATAVLWPANHKMHTFSLGNLVTEVTDNCGVVGIVRIRQVKSDEAADAEGSGNTPTDIMISADGQSVQLRAEREGHGNGRVYTLIVEAIDNNGNIGLAEFLVQVPHNANSNAVADAEAYAVNGAYSLTGNGQASHMSNSGLSAERNVQVFPNPVTGNEVNLLFFSEESGEALLSVTNTAAQKLLTIKGQVQSGQNHFRIPVSGLAKGIYLVSIQLENGRISKKFVIAN